MKNIAKNIALGLTLSFIAFHPLAASAQQPTAPMPQVIAYDVTAEEWTDKKEALGTLKANESIIITTNASETVTEVKFDSGDVVEKGQTILVFDQSEEQASLKASKSRLSERELAYNRASDLKKKDFTSKAVLDERKAALEETRAEIATIQARIKDRTITAPFKGVLGLRNVSVGAFVEANEMITTLDDLSVMKLDFALPETYLPIIKVGMNINAKAASFDTLFTGTIQSIESRVDPITRAVTVRAMLQNPDYILRPGMLMTVQILKDSKQSVVVPEETIISKASKSYVYKLTPEADGIFLVTETEIKPGTRQAGRVEVLEGLTAGDKIVSHGLQLVRNNIKVKILGTQSKDNPVSKIISKENASTEKPADKK